MKLLVDADYIVYKSCAGAEDEIDWGDDVILVISKFSEALNNVQRELSKIKGQFMWDVPELVLFFSDSKNFRKKIYPEYKGHRNRKKPCGYRRVISKLSEQYEVIRLPELEADDAMGIYATAYPGDIIVSPDKDMRQIPGKLYDLESSNAVIQMVSEVDGHPLYSGWQAVARSDDACLHVMERIQDFLASLSPEELVRNASLRATERASMS